MNKALMDYLFAIYNSFVMSSIIICIEKSNVKNFRNFSENRIIHKIVKYSIFKVASYLADFDTRWPHEYEIFNFARFSSRIW